MTHIVNTDSDGQQHVIWLQQKEDTCGPACIYMVECNRRMQSVIGGEVRIKEITKRMPDGYTEGSGTGAISALAKTLNSIGISATSTHVPDTSAHLDNVKLPVIVHIRWPNGKGHYAVAVRRTSSNDRIFLDPYYALVQSPRSAGNSYKVFSGVLASGFSAGGVLSGHIVEML